MSTPSRPHRAALVTLALVSAGLALVALVAWARARWLLADPYPIGIDGHYYAVQLRALVHDGALNYAASPLTFWLLAPGAALFGPVVGLKLGAALGTALAIWPAYLLGRRVGGHRASGLLAAALVATSASSMFLAAEFVKQGLGLTIALAQLAALAAALERPRPAQVALAVALAVGALLVHKSSFVLIAVVDGVALVVSGRLSRRWWLAGGAALAAVLVASALFPERLPGVRDAGTLVAALSPTPSWSLPALATPRTTLTFDHEALVAALAALAALPLAISGWRAGHPRAPLAVLFGVIAFALVQAIPWLDVQDQQGAAMRIRISAFVCLPVLVPFVVHALATRLPDALRAPRLLAAALGLTLLVSRPWSGGEGVSHVHPALVQVARAVGALLPPRAEVVTQDRQLAFMIRYYAGVDARVRYQPPKPGVIRYRLFVANLMRQADARPLRDAIRALWDAAPSGVVLPRSLNAFDELGAVIMPEATWRLLEARLPAASRAHFAAWPTT